MPKNAIKPFFLIFGLINFLGLSLAIYSGAWRLIFSFFWQIDFIMILAAFIIAIVHMVQNGGK